MNHIAPSSVPIGPHMARGSRAEEPDSGTPTQSARAETRGAVDIRRRTNSQPHQRRKPYLVVEQLGMRHGRGSGPRYVLHDDADHGLASHHLPDGNDSASRRRL